MGTRTPFGLGLVEKTEGEKRKRRENGTKENVSYREQDFTKTR